MNREFIRLPEFEKCWENAGLSEEDIVDLEYMLSMNPTCGDVISGTGGLRKVRFALPNRGKRGSLRILYVDFVSLEKIYLLGAYEKKEKENLTDKECNELKKVIERIEAAAKRRKP
jgi:hypothetical protein